MRKLLHWQIRQWKNDCLLTVVTYVGMISGSSSASGSASSMLTSSGGTHNLNVFRYWMKKSQRTTVRWQKSWKKSAKI
ncbi:MAG: hypothetical protein ACLUD0_20595 [Eubacterium ramulus]